ncbi:MAG: peptidyl-tRNA hydrolase, PTH1 family [Parcubacteria group bacterium Greene0714_21]|nr:MAG: peptidyl-tRNA hydrolase, PTH1 family [Parcubacteria group bacterium Greene0416_39]TSC98044.1 MAG: peptidyl-tRNA hydrolase, PTH1 family [Parcubacteria group bacterium Greene1014_47]TSD04165.1 MAG: peptidyl-tRNA hydrolase, PTH1 family [Parcubacteria group bacterium Greene0714_21]
MFLIVGLGNPGKKYERTRHNVGFMVLDALKEVELPNAILAKLQTFMNNSGKAVKSLVAKYQIPNTKYLVVVHDDIDILLGKIKVSFGRGSAGHKGVESIIKELGTKNFTRIRIGIQPTSSAGGPATGKPKNVETFVLKSFTPKETTLLQPAIAQAFEALTKVLLSS